MRNILYFFPDNPALIDQGNNARANTLLKYFNKRNFSVDLITEYNEHFDLEKLDLLKKEKLINNSWQLKKTVLNKKHFFSRVLPDKIYKGLIKFVSKKKYKQIYDLNKLRKGYKETFEHIIRQNNYDYILISYANWSPLIENIRSLAPNAVLINDTHDFITAQYQNQPHFDLGKYFAREINFLKKYDQVWAISTEEHFLFSQFIDESKVKLVPHGKENNFLKDRQAPPPTDLLYIASDNPHNIKSIHWFLENVYPKLPTEISITFIGKICKHLPNYQNITKIDFAENLDQYYRNTKVCLCPMLTGTGLKIKVVEALSYGLPVVCNQRGLDGLLNKTNNGCIATEFPAVFAAQIAKLLSDAEYYAKTSAAAKSFFEATLSETVVFNKLDSLFKN